MELVDNLLKYYKFSKPDQRSYFRLLANLERNIEIAGNTAVMTKGHELAGSSSFDLKTFINYWPGHRSLTNSDHDYIINIFPTLAQEAFCKGVLHISDWIPIIGEFVFEKNIEGCNEISLSLIAEEQQKEEKKPEKSKAIKSWDTIILTNPGHLEERRQEIERIKLEKKNKILEEETKKLENERKKKILDDKKIDNLRKKL